MAIRERALYPHDLPRIFYAQNHEDILIDRLFRGQIGTFVDIGACHPVRDGNTRFFYERGCAESTSSRVSPRSSSFATSGPRTRT